MEYDIVVIGGGPAGLAVAIEAKKNGIDSILIVEREIELGGILRQCIHSGFGIHYFKEELTGPEYAQRFINDLKNLGIEYILDTMVLGIGIADGKYIDISSSSEGFRKIKARAIVLATGCRERTREAVGIPGKRPSGIFTAGTAQRYINIEGYMVGKRVVILGSGDIGLIMARRLKLEGAEVIAVVEKNSQPGGLDRNVEQCIKDFGIPLLLNHTVTEISGQHRIEGVIISRVDENGISIPGSEENYPCDTLLVSVGLIPENEIAERAGIVLDNETGGVVVNEFMETNISGIYACGNSVKVHSLVDFVTEEAAAAGRNAAGYIKAVWDKK